MKMLVRTRARQSYSVDGGILGGESPVADGRRRAVVRRIAGVGVQHDVDIRDTIDQLPAPGVKVIVEPDRLDLFCIFGATDAAFHLLVCLIKSLGPIYKISYDLS